MTIRRALAAGSCLWACAGPVLAQEQAARSTEYLFATGPADIRGLWTNPASLSVVAQASLMGEVSFGRGLADDWRTSQYTFGISSRGVGLGYQRDRFEAGSHIGTWRLGGSVNLGRGAFGTAISFHDSRRGWDAGIRFSPSGAVHLAGVVRNIGRPTVRDSVLPITAVVGLGWHPGSNVRFSGELISVERHPDPGYALSYRAGAQLAFSSRSPFALLGALELGDDRRVRRWSVGLALGGLNQLVGVTSGLPSGSHRIEAVSLSAVSTRLLK